MPIPVDLTSTHLGISKAASTRTSNEPSQALVAIVFAAAAFESFLAAIVTHAQRHAEHDPEPIHAGAAALANVLPLLEKENAQWAVKLQVAAIALTGTSLSRGSQPYQDLDLLFRLRNHVVHPKLTWAAAPMDTPEGEHHKLVKSLVSRGIIEEPPTIPGIPGTEDEEKALVAPPTAGLLRPEVAVWAVNTAVTGMHSVADLVPQSVFREQLRWLLGTVILRGVQQT